MTGTELKTCLVVNASQSGRIAAAHKRVMVVVQAHQPRVRISRRREEHGHRLAGPWSSLHAALHSAAHVIRATLLKTGQAQAVGAVGGAESHCGGG
ncbi:hypothetical protein TYRP_015063 [Tyrophagus putrescentiae]|nr:hypothetical protein TYRP_015063 [Tyrophagus putrescentiae]